MRIQKILAVLMCSLGFVELNVSAAMINHVDFPAEFVKAKDQSAQQEQAQSEVTASTDETQK